MATVREWLQRFWGTFQQNRRDCELEDELRLHQQLAAEDALRREPLDDGPRTARLQVGGLAQAMEALRDQRGLPWLTDLARDLGFGWRLLARNRGFAVMAILTLVLAIGANTAIFSFVDGVLLKPLPYPSADRIVRVLEQTSRGDRNSISTLNFLDWQKGNAVFEFMAALETSDSATLTGRGEPIQLRGAKVSARYFDLFGIKAERGRTFLPDEDQRGHERVAVLSHAVWIDQFRADPSVVNRTIVLDHEPYTVVGILPAGSAFDRDFPQLWRPLAFEPSNMTRNYHWLLSFARLKSGVSLQQAQANMTAIGSQIALEFPDSNKGWGVIVERYADTLVGQDLRTALLVLLTATGLVLVIGCVNLANLVLARGLSREREVAIRAAIGAGRARLIRQLLTEHMLLALGGGALGIAVGYGAISGLQLLIPPFSFAREAQITMDARVLGFALAISLMTGVMFGTVPAIHATSPELTSVMKDGGRGATDRGSRRRLRDGLIVTEVALAFVLLVGSGLMMRSFMKLLTVDLGIDPTNVLTLGVPVLTERFPDPVQLNTYLREIRQAVDAVPGVRETAWSCSRPMMAGGCYGMPIQVASQPILDRANRRGGNFKIVSPSYFSSLRLRMVRGRALSDRDTKGMPPVLVINERLARREFHNQNPVGQQLLFQEITPGKTELGRDVLWQIVGVVHDETVHGIDDDRNEAVYVSNEQSPRYFQWLNVRTDVRPLALQQSIVAAIHRVDKDQAVTDIQTVDQLKDLGMADPRLRSVLLGIFAIVGVLLAAIGIYGVTAYSVTQRTHEIGVRAALGATGMRLIRLVIARGLVLTWLGLAIGIVGALALTPLMASLLFGVGAHDPATMVLVGVLLAAVALAACYVPASRATRVDPMTVLRTE
jgi:putative ABC transport system permease protein